jgi:DNA-binding CsgD family transcriptional regulator
VLVGRSAECERIEALLAGARGGTGGALVLRGGPGIGKSALLAYAGERSSGMRVLRARGVETEAELAFAGLHQAFHPVLDRLDGVPEPQGAALAAALGLAEPQEPDRFLIAAAALSLASEVAADQPLLVLVDDVHWLDAPSADALLFVARRLEAEPAAMVFSVRDDIGDGAATDLPGLPLRPLDRDEARELVEASASGLNAEGRELVLASAYGNPLALVELASGLAADRETGQDSPREIHLSATLERTFFGRAKELPEGTQRLLLLAAADEVGDIGTLLRAAGRLGIGGEALAPAEHAGLVRLRETVVEFRHPLVRSAVYQSAAFSDRQAAHRALADALTGPAHADRRAWHRAAAAVAPDEEAAAEVERVAARARARGAPAAAASAFERAASLTADDELRARRLTDAGEAARDAGTNERALAFATEAARYAGDPVQRGRIDQLNGTIEARRGDVREGFAILANGAKRIAQRDPLRAAAMLAEAASAAAYAGDTAGVAEAGRSAAALPARDDPEFAFDVLLLAGTTAVLERDPERGLPLLREAMALAEASSDPSRLVRAGVAAIYAGEDAAARAFWMRGAREARTRGALGTLSFALEFLAASEATSGNYAAAFADASEGLRLAREIGAERSAAMHLARAASALAVLGREDECRRHADEAIELATARGLGLVIANARWALGVLELGLGRPAEALSRLESLVSDGPGKGYPLIGLFATPDLVEAALRADRIERAQTALATFEAWASATELPWALAALARCRGLLSVGRTALAHLEEAVELHGDGERPFDAARSRLVLGELLRRERRRVDARPHLRAALESFDRLGAAPWAERAAAELRASGETARRRDPSAAGELTPQELQIARLVAEGATNKDVAAQLFLSPRTVDYHLRKVFMKLGLSSRAELHRIDLAG